MTVTYFKRYRMQIDVSSFAQRPAAHFEGYVFERWRMSLLDEHADAKFASFRSELDSHVFPCLGNANGCQKLMAEISSRKGFVPEATWLLLHDDPNRLRAVGCGTVQGIRESLECGSIQNLGVAAPHRGRGLGRELLLRALTGFAQTGVRHVHLEVTGQNEGAIKLYQQLGFSVKKLVYKSVDLERAV